MSLTQQFLIVSIFPLTFLGMGYYLLRSGLKRRELLHRWGYALVAATVWATSVLRFYGGTTFSLGVTFTWGVIGKYAFSLTAVLILLTTFSHLAISRRYGRFSLNLSILILLLALFLDFEIWPYYIPDFTLVGQSVTHFDVWTAVWVASWLVPALAAWMLTQQVKANFPNSLYRNQMRYWLFMLVLFMIGGSLTSIQQPGQPVWQEAGLLVVIFAFLTGTISIARSHLPDLQLALRHLLIRLLGALVVFGLTWLVLFLVMAGVFNLPADTSSNLVLVLAAAFFAGFLTLIYRLVNGLVRRLFLPGGTRREAVIENFQNATGQLVEPDQLGQLWLQIIQSDLGTDDAWFFVVEDGPGAKLILRPLTSLKDGLPSEAAVFGGDSYFSTYLRQNRAPLVQYDVDTLSSFDGMPAEEKALLTGWKRVLYVPVHAGSRLVGLVALGEKATGETYNRKDFEGLRSLTPQISPLLVQAQNLAGLRQVNDFVFAQNQALAYEKQHLGELLNLFAQFIELISPDLRRPFIPMSQQIELLQAVLNDHDLDKQPTNELKQQIENLRTALDQLIAISGRLQKRNEFAFQELDLDDVTQQAIRSLQTMAETRRVHIEYAPVNILPKVLGDGERLQEAIRHLLHNAIKFNKIGGTVQLKFDTQGEHLCLHLSDTGVGIPKERLAALWQGLSHKAISGNGRNPGLGLTLTQYIVAAHGGHVEAESQHGSGSVFSIYLPIAFVET